MESAGPVWASVRSNGSGDDLLYDTDAPSGNFTAMFWLYITTDRNAFSCALWMGSDTSGDYAASIYLGTDSNGTTLAVYSHNSTATATISGTNLSTATWYHVALVGNTGISQSMTLYLNGASDGTGTSGSEAAFSAQRVQLINDTASEFFNGRVMAFKLYNAQLTLAEIQQEMRHIRPVRTENLWQWAPLWGSGDVVDYSGNGRSFTATSLATEDNPPVGW